jgi:hypothetical protein
MPEAGRHEICTTPGEEHSTLRRMRRMILPDRVFGRPGASRIVSGCAKGPTCWRTMLLSSPWSFESIANPGRKMTNAKIALPLTSCGTCTQALSATAACMVSADSTSAVPIRCPLTFITAPRGEGENGVLVVRVQKTHYPSCHESQDKHHSLRAQNAKERIRAALNRELRCLESGALLGAGGSAD